MRNTKMFKQGLAVRRAVLGAEYVDRAMANADAFTGTLQDFVTEWCWGGVWARPGLPRKTRSLLNLAMLTALNRPHEIKLHVRGALNNGVTRQEITEVFLQAGVYAGVPAAVDAFRSAKEVFDELDKKK
jgi:4-carboxymuconolactone decarboxylase